jgi:hypothetical protein
LGTDLADHLSSCAACAEAVAIAAAFRAEREAAVAEAPVPSAGVVWWKADLRKRREQAQAACRPVLLAHGVALVALLAAILGAASMLAPHAGALLGDLSAWPGSSVRLPLPSLDLAALAQPGIVLAAAAALLLAPLALYLAFSRE